ncbi:DUF1569 domain-containing protein [Chitinophaga sp. Cy-1792]|uniref:DUF1569 domain-containing protein n=1 Tax=Chitinophaga sp. Cy-1792 TaxID=2608339 RepID=UPI0014226185|nr:DUF1569 domain-containing protein [Chitinophaga sp. Cy-1792]NIG55682.1 DUF1569 domain-containing protein [Chitinophaga sp. Cy-1792]
MKTTRDAAARAELFDRIQGLDVNAVAQWGKMDVRQMVQHCIMWEELSLGRIKTKRSFIGRIFGRVALKRMLNDAIPIGRNMPTSPEVKIVSAPAGDFSIKKQQWIGLIEEDARTRDGGIIHPFFGKMTRDEMCQLSYRHADHHLRQFNA